MATLMRACVLGLVGMGLFHSSNPHQNVGIQDRLQTSDGRRLTERMAPSVTGRFKLHLQRTIGGFLGVWTTADGRLLTPDYEGFAGHKVEGGQEYVVPGDFRTSASEADGVVLVLFARSQSEQASKVEDALQKLSRLLPLIVKRPDETPGSIGTYVGSPEGGPLAVQIPVTR